MGEVVVDFFHRKRLTLPAKPLKKSHANVNIMRFEVGALISSVDLADVVPMPQYLVEEFGSLAEIARLVRATWRVPPGPLPDLVALIEATGTPVLYSELAHEKLAAMSMPGVFGSHLIVLNSALPASAHRFSLAHELAHLIMHRGIASEDLERDADEFAAELLMPAADIRPSLRGLRFNELVALKAIWHVSLAALIRTAHHLGKLTDRQYRYFNMQLNKLPGGRKREPGEFPREEPRLVKSIIERMKTELGYTNAEVAHVMGCTEEVLRSRYLGELVTTTLRAVPRAESRIGPPTAGPLWNQRDER